MIAHGSRFRSGLSALCCGVLLALAGCGDSSLAGSEVENEFKVVALNSDGRPAVGARVALVPADYSVSKPGEGHFDSATVKADGTVEFDRVPNGTYNIVATLGDQGGAVTGVTLSHDRRSVQTVLRPLAILRGTLANRDPILPGAKSVKAEIVGTLASAEVAENGAFTLAVPAGRYSAVRFIAQGESNDKPLPDSLASGDNEAVTYQAEPLTRRVLGRLTFDAKGVQPTIGGDGFLRLTLDPATGDNYPGRWWLGKSPNPLSSYLQEANLNADSGVVFTVPAGPLGGNKYFGFTFDDAPKFSGYWGIGFSITSSPRLELDEFKICSKSMEIGEDCQDPVQVGSTGDGSVIYSAPFVGGRTQISSVWISIDNVSRQPIRVSVRSIHLN